MMKIYLVSNCLGFRASEEVIYKIEHLVQLKKLNTQIHTWCLLLLKKLNREMHI
jgi:hypothetical protein